MKNKFITSLLIFFFGVLFISLALFIHNTNISNLETINNCNSTEHLTYAEYDPNTKTTKYIETDITICQEVKE